MSVIRCHWLLSGVSIFNFEEISDVILVFPLLIWTRKYLLGHFGFMCRSLLTAVKKICFLKIFSGKHQRCSFSTSSSFDKNTGRHGIIKKKYGHIVVCVCLCICVCVCVCSKQMCLRNVKRQLGSGDAGRVRRKALKYFWFFLFKIC